MFLVLYFRVKLYCWYRSLSRDHKHSTINKETRAECILFLVMFEYHSLPRTECCVWSSAVLTCWSMEILIWDTLRTGRPAGRTTSVSITNVSPSNSSTSAPAQGPPTKPSAPDMGYTNTETHTDVNSKHTLSFLGGRELVSWGNSASGHCAKYLESWRPFYIFSILIV